MSKTGNFQATLGARSFQTRFRNLILLAWTGPPIVGLSFLFYIRMFSGEQMLGILLSPLENVFVSGSLFLLYGILIALYSQ